MRRSRIVGLAVALAVVGAVAAWKSTAGAQTGPATIRVVERQFGYTRVDVGRHGLSPGDSEVVMTRIFNKRVTMKPIGSARYICTFADGMNRVCTATVSLPKGQLVAIGNVRFRQFYSLAIVGGTGLYNDGRGTLTVIRTTSKPTREILYFRLTG